MLDSNPWINFFVALTVLANVATLTLWVLGIASALGFGRALWQQVRDALGDTGITLAAIVAGTAMVGSLYMSEGAHFLPCKLCWYQRIGMYSLAIILVIAAVRRDWNIRIYATTLAVLGGIVSTYHYLIERFPSLEKGTSCDPTNPCTFVWFFHLHYISIPFMALSAFALVATMLSVARPAPTEDDGERVLDDALRQEESPV
ncbi:MAG TPA: disulfide bond formation protein B [Acidimicrobiia bacterium]|nr:disulfide bond formation protein B [Acidimicrobiia bacterium]